MTGEADLVITEALEGASTAAVAVRVRDLTVTFPTPDGPLPAVAGVSLELAPGAITGLVGSPAPVSRPSR